MKSIRLNLHDNGTWSLSYRGETKELTFDKLIEELGKIANGIERPEQEGDAVWVPPHNVSVVVK